MLNQCSCIQCDFCKATGRPGSLKGGCCGQKTVRLTIKERMFGQEAVDDEDCCLESWCLQNCFGAKCADQCCGGVCGEGCYFSMCNPCGVNCCSMNTMYISTNDPEGLLKLIGEKTGKKSKTGRTTISETKDGDGAAKRAVMGTALIVGAYAPEL